MSAMIHFLLVFDHRAGRLVKAEQYTDARRAVAEYTVCEHKHRDDPQTEIVLIGSDSIETVKLTHANYFDGSVALSRHLAGL